MGEDVTAVLQSRRQSMPLVSGARLGPYQIEAAIGAGGMGEVYRARDTRLGRSVAIKVLPTELSSDPERRARFEREAKTIGGLTHPHICTLYDVGEHNGSTYLVMEHLQGETLAGRLEKGRLPLDEALGVATEVADALAAAHKQGIIHRDLKPGNVMLTKAGAKLLDFGLAKLKGHGAEPAVGHLASTLTRSAPLTAEGTIVGTLDYMAPEQLEGKEADARTDLWALGAMLYEMVTGRRAFEGDSQVSLIGNIMNAEPAALSMLQPLTPPSLQRVVKRCLAKHPDDRWDTAHDVADELRWIAEGGSPAGETWAAAVPKRTGARILWTAVTVLGLALAASLAVIGTLVRKAPAARPPVRFTVAPPAPYAMDFQVPAVSPDGTTLAFTARLPGEPPVLFVRALESADAKVVPETAGAASPFWSPDGRQVGFFSGGKLKKVPLAGGSPIALADGLCCGTWGRDGEILFTYSGMNTTFSEIMRVSSEGGVASPVLHPDRARGETGHRWPTFLPDNRHFLYQVNSPRADVQGVYVASIGSSEATRVMPAATNVVFMPPGCWCIDPAAGCWRRPLTGSSRAWAGRPCNCPTRSGGEECQVRSLTRSFAQCRTCWPSCRVRRRQASWRGWTGKATAWASSAGRATTTARRFRRTGGPWLSAAAILQHRRAISG